MGRANGSTMALAAVCVGAMLAGCAQPGDVAPPDLLVVATYGLHDQDTAPYTVVIEAPRLGLDQDGQWKPGILVTVKPDGSPPQRSWADTSWTATVTSPPCASFDHEPCTSVSFDWTRRGQALPMAAGLLQALADGGPTPGTFRVEETGSTTVVHVMEGRVEGDGPGLLLADGSYHFVPGDLLPIRTSTLERRTYEVRGAVPPLGVWTVAERPDSRVGPDLFALEDEAWDSGLPGPAQIVAEAAQAIPGLGEALSEGCWTGFAMALDPRGETLLGHPLDPVSVQHDIHVRTVDGDGAERMWWFVAGHSPVEDALGLRHYSLITDIPIANHLPTTCRMIEEGGRAAWAPLEMLAWASGAVPRSDFGPSLEAGFRWSDQAGWHQVYALGFGDQDSRRPIEAPLRVEVAAPRHVLLEAVLPTFVEGQPLPPP